MSDISAESAALVHARAATMLHKRVAQLAPGKAATVHVFLPGCRACGEKHPLAFKPALAVVDVCPKCGADVLPPEEPVLSDAELATGGPSSWVARILLSAGGFFARLSKRLEDGK